MRFTTSLLCLALSLPAWGAPSAQALDTLRVDVATAAQQVTAAARAEVYAQEAFSARNGILRFDDAMGPAALVTQRILDGADTLDTRVALIDALRRIPGTQWHPWMSTLSQHADDAELRAAATEQLRYIDTEWSLPALVATMKDPHPRVREAAVRAAGRLSVSDAPIDELITCLGDADDAVAGFAARSLGWLQVPQAREGIEALLKRDNERTRRDAQNALNRLR